MTSENAIAEIRQLSLEVGNAKIDYLERIADLNKWAGLTAVCTTLFVGGFVGSLFCLVVLPFIIIIVSIDWKDGRKQLIT